LVNSWTLLKPTTNLPISSFDVTNRLSFKLSVFPLASFSIPSDTCSTSVLNDDAKL
jgi:hypothetical protein